MALTKIGAQIGVEGYSEFNKAIKNINNDLKEFASETKLMTAQLGEEAKSLKGNKEAREQLAKTVEKLEEKYKKEKEGIDLIIEGRKKLTEEYKNGNITSEEYAKALEKSKDNEQRFRIAANETATQLELNRKAYNETIVSISDYAEGIKNVGKELTERITKPLIGFGKEAFNTSVSFESAFTGVRKTVDGTEEELKDLNDQLKQIPLRTASTYETVAGVAEQAGQLNVPLEEIANFTEQIIMLADSTNIDADEGAISIAKFLNIVGEGPETVNKFGNALVALGNKTATDEQSIMRLASRLASAGKMAGLSTSDILGLSAAMSSVGLTAEAGGTAISTVLTKITKAVASGGDDLQMFADVVGKSAQDFADAWRSNPTDALQEFIIGMGNLEGGSEELLTTLDELGFKGIRESDTLRRLILDNDGLTRAIELSNEAYSQGNDLRDEASKRYETMESQLSQLKETFRLILDDIGERLVPLVKKAGEELQKLADWWFSLSDGTRDTIVKFGVFIATVGPLLVTIGSIISAVVSLKTNLAILKGVKGIAGVTNAIKGSGGLISSITGTGGLLSALGVVGTALGLAGAFIWATKKGKEIREELKASGDKAQEVAEKYRIPTHQLKLMGYEYDSTGKLINTKTTEIKRDVNSMAESLTGDLERSKQRYTDYTSRVQTETYKMVQTGVDGFRNFRNEATTSGEQGAINFASGITQNSYRASNAAQTLRQNVDLSGLKNSSYQWGADLADNMANGMNSRTSKIKEASSWLASKIRSYLHFSEPDTGPLSDFHTYMPDMLSQMAKGINDNAYLVENALSNLTGNMSSQLNGNNYNYGGVSIYLNVPEGTNGRQLVDEIENEMANRTMRRRAVFG